MKKWRYPFIGIGVFLAFLVSFEGTGDVFKTDVLSAGDVQAIQNLEINGDNLDYAKKSLTEFMYDEVSACIYSEMYECSTEGQSLMNAISHAGSPEEIKRFFVDVSMFAVKWDAALAGAKCEKEIGEDMTAVIVSLEKLESSVIGHKDTLAEGGAKAKEVAALKDKVSELQKELSCE